MVLGLGFRVWCLFGVDFDLIVARLWGLVHWGFKGLVSGEIYEKPGRLPQAFLGFHAGVGGVCTPDL